MHQRKVSNHMNKINFFKNLKRLKINSSKEKSHVVGRFQFKDRALVISGITRKYNRQKMQMRGGCYPFVYNINWESIIISSNILSFSMDCWKVFTLFLIRAVSVDVLWSWLYNILTCGIMLQKAMGQNINPDYSNIGQIAPACFFIVACLD